jgi:hypothetical protein
MYKNNFRIKSGKCKWSGDNINKKEEFFFLLQDGGKEKAGFFYVPEYVKKCVFFFFRICEEICNRRSIKRT